MKISHDESEKTFNKIKNIFKKLRTIKVISVIILSFPPLFLITPVLFRNYSLNEILYLTYYTTLFIIPLSITTVGSNFIYASLKTNKEIGPNDYTFSIYLIDIFFRAIILFLTYIIYYFNFFGLEQLKPVFTILVLINIFNVLDNAFSNLCFTWDNDIPYLLYAAVRSLVLFLSFNLQWIIGFEIKWYFASLLASHVAGLAIIIWCHLHFKNMRINAKLHIVDCLKIGLTMWPSTLFGLVYNALERSIVLSITPSTELIVFELIRNARRLNSFIYSGIERVFISFIDQKIIEKQKINYKKMFIFTSMFSLNIAFIFPFLVSIYYGSNYKLYSSILFPAYSLLVLSIISLILSRVFSIIGSLTEYRKIDLYSSIIGLISSLLLLLVFGVESILYVSLIVPLIGIMMKLKNLGLQFMWGLILFLAGLPFINGVFIG